MKLKNERNVDDDLERIRHGFCEKMGYEWILREAAEDDSEKSKLRHGGQKTVKSSGSCALHLLFIISCANACPFRR
nr:hypothetical protein [Tanacetum cinerariifolium]